MAVTIAASGNWEQNEKGTKSPIAIIVGWECSFLFQKIK